MHTRTHALTNTHTHIHRHTHTHTGYTHNLISSRRNLVERRRLACGHSLGPGVVSSRQRGSAGAEPAAERPGLHHARLGAPRLPQGARASQASAGVHLQTQQVQHHRGPQSPSSLLSLTELHWPWSPSVSHPARGLSLGLAHYRAHAQRVVLVRSRWLPLSGEHTTLQATCLSGGWGKPLVGGIIGGTIGPQDAVSG